MTQAPKSVPYPRPWEAIRGVQPRAWGVQRPFSCSAAPHLTPACMPPTPSPAPQVRTSGLHPSLSLSSTLAFPAHVQPVASTYSMHPEPSLSNTRIADPGPLPGAQGSPITCLPAAFANVRPPRPSQRLPMCSEWALKSPRCPTRPFVADGPRTSLALPARWGHPCPGALGLAVPFAWDARPPDSPLRTSSYITSFRPPPSPPQVMTPVWVTVLAVGDRRRDSAGADPRSLLVFRLKSVRLWAGGKGGSVSERRGRRHPLVSLRAL